MMLKSNAAVCKMVTPVVVTRFSTRPAMISRVLEIELRKSSYSKCKGRKF